MVWFLVADTRRKYLECLPCLPSLPPPINWLISNLGKRTRPWTRLYHIHLTDGNQVWLQSSAFGSQAITSDFSSKVPSPWILQSAKKENITSSHYCNSFQTSQTKRLIAKEFRSQSHIVLSINQLEHLFIMVRISCRLRWNMHGFRFPVHAVSSCSIFYLI